jgi:hypothetical protein
MPIEVAEAAISLKNYIAKFCNDNPPMKRNDFIQREAANLIEDGSIIFRPADKNLGLVTLPVTEYDSLVRQLLDDATTKTKYMMAIWLL